MSDIHHHHNALLMPETGIPMCYWDRTQCMDGLKQRTVGKQKQHHTTRERNITLHVNARLSVFVQSLTCFSCASDGRQGPVKCQVSRQEARAPTGQTPFFPLSSIQLHTVGITYHRGLCTTNSYILHGLTY